MEDNCSISSTIQFSLLAIANLSLKCFLKFSFSSSLSSKCFWVFTFSTTRLLQYRSGYFRECDFLKKTLPELVYLDLGSKLFFIARPICEFFLSHWLVHFQSLTDRIFLKIKRYHQQIVLHCDLNCLLGH